MSRQWRWSMKNAWSRTLSHPPTPPPEPPPTNTQRINTYVTSMKMIHEERTIKNVLLYLKGERRVCSSSCSPASTSMCASVRVPFMVCACQGTLISHPIPPHPTLVQLRLYVRGERSIESVLRLYFKGERRVCSSSCTPAATSMCASVRVPFLVCACQGTLISHPTPPLVQLRLYFRGERSIESVLRLYLNG